MATDKMSLVSQQAQLQPRPPIRFVATVGSMVIRSLLNQTLLF